MGHVDEGDWAPGNISSPALAPPLHLETGLQWSNLEMRSDMALETDFQDSLDHSMRPIDVERQL